MSCKDEAGHLRPHSITSAGRKQVTCMGQRKWNLLAKLHSLEDPSVLSVLSRPQTLVIPLIDQRHQKLYGMYQTTCVRRWASGTWATALAKASAKYGTRIGGSNARKEQNLRLDCGFISTYLRCQLIIPSPWLSVS